jgi:hypothetical protein
MRRCGNNPLPIATTGASRLRRITTAEILPEPLTSRHGAFLEHDVTHRPTWSELAETIHRHHTAHPPVIDDRPGPYECGDIVVATGGGISRCLLVHARTFEEGVGEYLECLLCDSLPEMATDLDLIIEPQRPVRPFTLVAYTELYLTVFPHQVVRRLGSIPAEMAKAAECSLWTDGEAIKGYPNGRLPLAGPSDPRWSHRGSLLSDDLIPLRNESLGVLLDGRYGPDR